MILEHVAGKNVGDIKLFALSTCPWCKKTKALLDSLGVEYSFVDVDLLTGKDREQAVGTVKKWNPSVSFPTLVINDNKTIVGYKEQEIKDALSV
jgi:glutaredoxin